MDINTTNNVATAGLVAAFAGMAAYTVYRENKSRKAIEGLERALRDAKNDLSRPRGSSVPSAPASIDNDTEHGKDTEIWKLMGLLFKPHPWHGISIGDSAPEKITCYVEVVPADTIKYEVDKKSGYLCVDRPQKFSNICPAIYGFVPQTYCDSRVAQLCRDKTGIDGILGDMDPLDICILSEKSLTHGDLLLQAIPIGGLVMIDNGEADDKIIAVLEGDGVYGAFKDVKDLPEAVVNRINHYFLTYKQAPGAKDQAVQITSMYSREEAHEVIRAAQADYWDKFSGLGEMLHGSMVEAVVHKLSRETERRNKIRSAQGL